MNREHALNTAIQLLFGDQVTESQESILSDLYEKGVRDGQSLKVTGGWVNEFSDLEWQPLGEFPPLDGPYFSRMTETGEWARETISTLQAEADAYRIYGRTLDGA